MQMQESDHLDVASADFSELEAVVESMGWTPIENQLSCNLNGRIGAGTWANLNRALMSQIGENAWRFLKFCLSNGHGLEEWTSDDQLGLGFARMLAKLQQLAHTFGSKLNEAQEFFILGDRGVVKAEIMEGRNSDGVPTVLQLSFDLLDGSQTFVRITPRNAVRFWFDLKRIADEQLSTANFVPSDTGDHSRNGSSRGSSKKSAMGFQPSNTCHASEQ